MPDPNADLIGFEWTDSMGDPPPTWRVLYTDPLLGPGYVMCEKVHDPEYKIIRQSGIVRSAKRSIS